MIELRKEHTQAHIVKAGPAVEMQRWAINTRQERVRLKSPHFHNEYQVGFIDTGVIENTYRKAKRIITPHQLYLIQPGEVHAEYSLQPTALRFSFAFVSATQFTQAIEDLTDGRKHTFTGSDLLVQNPAINQRLVAQTAAYFAALQVPNTELERETKRIDWLTAIVLSQAEEKPALKNTGKESRAVKSVKTYLQDCFGEPVSLDMLSKVACLSKYHLLRTFSRETGMTIHHYQMQLRICKAKELLRSGQPVSQVALELGFADQAHFSHCFKRFTSQTPGQF